MLSASPVTRSPFAALRINSAQGLQFSAVQRKYRFFASRKRRAPLRMTWLAFFIKAVVAVALAASPALAKGSEVKLPLPLEGKLVEVPGTGPALRVGHHDYPLSARTSWLFHTLQDKRLVNREIRAEGQWEPDGTLQVSEFYRVKDGKLYRVRYYCATCNIQALEPGNCVCCQAPTELQEIPVAGK